MLKCELRAPRKCPCSLGDRATPRYRVLEPALLAEPQPARLLVLLAWHLSVHSQTPCSSWPSPRPAPASWPPAQRQVCAWLAAALRSPNVVKGRLTAHAAMPCHQPAPAAGAPVPAPRRRVCTQPQAAARCVRSRRLQELAVPGCPCLLVLLRPPGTAPSDADRHVSQHAAPCGRAAAARFAVSASAPRGGVLDAPSTNLEKG